MSKSVPGCLARLAQDLDLHAARGRPSALGRLVFVILLFHANGRMFAWPGRERLAWLTGCDEAAVRKAIRLLEERNAITRHSESVDGVRRQGWRVRLTPETSDGPGVQQRVFWPNGRPRAPGDDQTLPYRALLHVVGNRTHVAAILMFYQFAREPDHAAAGGPMPPNNAWISRVLSTSVNTVYASRREALERGIATQGESGLLVFADPASWPELLGCPELPPMARAQPAVRVRLEVVPEPVTMEPVACESTEPVTSGPIEPDTSGPIEPAAGAANGATYAGCAPEVKRAAIELVLALAARGLVVADDLGREIITECVRRWGPEETRARLATQLAGPCPMFALEALGHALGPEFECPGQLVAHTPALVRFRELAPKLPSLDIPGRDPRSPLLPSTGHVRNATDQSPPPTAR